MRLDHLPKRRDLGQKEIVGKRDAKCFAVGKVSTERDRSGEAARLALNYRLYA